MSVVRKVRSTVRKFAQEHRTSRNSGKGGRQVLAQKIKWARKQFGGKGRSALKEAMGY